MGIEEIRHRIIFDSRGDETVEAEVISKEKKGIASCPSGASKSAFEVLNIPEQGLEKAIEEFRKNVRPLLIGIDPSEQEKIDSIMLSYDGTKNLSRLGGAIILSTSIANLKLNSLIKNNMLFELISQSKNYNLPIPLGNVIGGGKHAKGRSIDIQEILVFSKDAQDIHEAIKLNIMLHRKVFKLLSLNDPNFAGGKNDEGALVTRIGIKKALSIVKQAIKEIRLEKGRNLALGLDVAASSLWDGEKYVYFLENLSLDSSKQMEFMSNLIEEFEIEYIEDPFHEEDFSSFAELLEKFKDRLIVGDDLYASNKERIQKGIKEKSTNGIIIKPNQVGCVTRIIESIDFAKENNLKVIVSHRSGETEDIFISHLAVACSATLIKTGILGGERISKLNELLRIAEHLNWNYSLSKV